MNSSKYSKHLLKSASKDLEYLSYNEEDLGDVNEEDLNDANESIDRDLESYLSTLIKLIINMKGYGISRGSRIILSNIIERDISISYRDSSHLINRAVFDRNNARSKFKAPKL